MEGRGRHWNGGTVRAGNPVWSWFLLAWFVGSPLSQVAPGHEREPTFTFVELAPGALAAVVVPDPPHYAFANSLVVDLGGELLVVDTQQSPAAAEALIAEIRRRWTEPVRWVVNTHWHGDHVYGNIAYRNAWPGVVFLTHRATREGLLDLGRAQLERDRLELPASIEQRRRWIAEGRGPDGAALTETQRARVARSIELRTRQVEQLRTLALVPADSVFDDRLSLAGRSRTAELIFLGPAHTRGDVAVWLPAERILAAGDLVEDAYPWVENAHIAGWALALERINVLAPRVVLPAHGSPWLDPVPRLEAQRALFRAALGAACIEDNAVPPALSAFRAAHGLADGDSELRFWNALLAAARSSAACSAVISRDPG